MGKYEFFKIDTNSIEDNFYYFPIVEIREGNKAEKLKRFKKKVKEGRFNNFLSFQKSKSEQFSGIFNPEEGENYLKKLPKYSFIIQQRLRLVTPYFSKDENPLSIIANPILKETAFKVPMIRGSSWKGALRHSGLKIIQESNESESIRFLKSLLRIFGTGADSFRAILESMNSSDVERKIRLFLALEVGINSKNTAEQFKEYLEKESRKPFKGAKKGRAIFYPTFFDRLSFEVINPHDRRKRAGTKPITYEVVPKGTEGGLQIIYIPFDGILKPQRELEKEVRVDLQFLRKCIERTATSGIGGKSKMWGKFEIERENVRVKRGDEIVDIEQFLEAEGGTQ